MVLLLSLVVVVVVIAVAAAAVVVAVAVAAAVVAAAVAAAAAVVVVEVVVAFLMFPQPYYSCAGSVINTVVTVSAGTHTQCHTFTHTHEARELRQLCVWQFWIT